MALSEFEIISKYFSSSELAATRQDLILGIGDDCAAITVPPDKTLCVSMDVLNVDVHFPQKAEPELIGERALRVNLSDLAAVGAEPSCFTLGLSLPDNDEDWLAGFSKGLATVATNYQCPLVGGDITKGPLAITIQVQGVVDEMQLIRRDKASVGDLIYVTGTLGNGGIALASMGIPVQFDTRISKSLSDIADETKRYLQERFYQPVPRLEFARQVAAYIHAGIDISDGLVGDLGHILAASGVGATIDSGSLPFDAHVEGITTVEQRTRAALYGGDDYELCFTVASEQAESVEQQAKQLGLRLSKIGVVEEDPGLRQQLADGQKSVLKGCAYDHFAPRETE